MCGGYPVGVLVCCIYCREVRSARGIHTHVDRAHLNKMTYFSGNHGKYDVLSNRAKDKYYQNPKMCFGCQKVLVFDLKRNTYCSRSCAASTTNVGKKHSAETKQKQSITKRRLDVAARADPKYKFNRECAMCGTKFISHRKLKKYLCSDECKKKSLDVDRGVGYNVEHGYKTKEVSGLPYYRNSCGFGFNMADFNDEFDFELIRKHGWYKPTNRGNNLGGVSRDHMYSVKDGYTNKVHPDIMAHPANCRLMIHSDNISKNYRSSITLVQLLERIAWWEEKYGAFTPTGRKPIT